MVNAAYCREKEAVPRRHQQQPKQQQVDDFLAFRELLKAGLRKKSAGSENIAKKRVSTAAGTLGSFFGPSERVIAQRVIQESKSLLKNPNLASKILLKRSNNNNNKAKSCRHRGSYVSPSAAVIGSSKPPRPSLSSLKNTIGFEKILQRRREEREYYAMLFSGDESLQSLATKKLRATDTRGSAPRSAGANNEKPVVASSGRALGEKPIVPPPPPKIPVGTTPKPNVSRPAARRESQEFNKAKVLKDTHQQKMKPPVARMGGERIIKKKPPRHVSADPSDISQMIWKMFTRNGPRKFCEDDDDDRDIMESGFDRINEEEKRSEKLARKEDRDELRKIAEEEAKEKARKKRRLL